MDLCLRIMILTIVSSVLPLNLPPCILPYSFTWLQCFQSISLKLWSVLITFSIYLLRWNRKAGEGLEWWEIPFPFPYWHKILESCSDKVLTLGEKVFVMAKALDVFPCLSPWPPSISTGDLSPILPMRSAVVPGEKAHQNTGPPRIIPKEFWAFY